MTENSAKPIPLSLGFIGGGLDSAVGYAHFVSCLMDNKWTLNAGCFSFDKQQNQETAQTYGVNFHRVYDDWQKMLMKEKDRLDAIVILTPTPMHYEIVMSCLDEGLPVICEKSLVTNSAEAEKVLKLRNKKNGFLAMTYNYSGYPMIREMRNRIRKQEFGKILHFQVEMPQEVYLRVDAQDNKFVPQSWRLNDGQVPMIHLDLGSHLHQLIDYLIEKKPIEVVSNQESYGWFPEVIDNVTSLCRYSEGVDGQIWFSKSALGNRNGIKLRIYGSKSSIEWFHAAPEELLISYSDGRREILDRASTVEVANLRRYNRFKAGHPAGYIEAYANLYTDIADCLHQHKATGRWKSENVFSVELAAEGLRFLEAMQTSVSKRAWQYLDILNEKTK